MPVVYPLVAKTIFWARIVPRGVWTIEVPSLEAIIDVTGVWV